MFERYTEKARRVIFFARYEASNFGAPAIEPEHLLLGLLREDPVLARLLPATMSLSTVRKELETRTLLREKISTSVELPLAPESKAVLAYAHEESDRLLDRHIGTEHLLLGLLREERSVAAEILYNHGVRIEAAREAIRLNQAPTRGWGLPEFDPKATEVDLAKYGLAKVPDEIKKIKQLRKLHLAGNNLTELPEFLGHLTHLEYLMHLVIP